MSRGPAPAPPVQQPPSVPAPVAPSAGAIGRALGSGTSDQEKVHQNSNVDLFCIVKTDCIPFIRLAALIMQVLQLSDEQIALLPPDQRQSIMVLKEQIARSSRP